MRPHDIPAVLRGLPASPPFTKLASFNHGGVFVGRFTGQAPWERHRHGDELVHVLDGEVDITVMTSFQVLSVEASVLDFYHFYAIELPGHPVPPSSRRGARAADAAGGR